VAEFAVIGCLIGPLLGLPRPRLRERNAPSRIAVERSLKKTCAPAAMAWLYGPTGFGAFGEQIVRLIAFASKPFRNRPNVDERAIDRRKSRIFRIEEHR
jgi:hypothetical protein